MAYLILNSRADVLTKWKRCCCSETFGHIEKNIPAWRKKLGFYGKTEHFKMLFVSIADKICSQTQKNGKFWVWSALISNIEKIYSKTCILPLEFPEYWAWERIVCHICPNHMLFCGVFLTAIYDLSCPPDLARTSCNT